MATVLLGVTGSVAAIKTPELVQLLLEAGHEVQVVTTHSALYFFDPASLNTHRTVRLITDEDEWPGQDTGQRYHRGQDVLHIELRRWAELFLVAPLDANTLAKFSHGICDNCLTSVWRAWDFQKPAILAPAMNTLMWDKPLTHRQLQQLQADATLEAGREEMLQIIPPIEKELACGDTGTGAMAELPTIVAVCQQVLDKRIQEA
ncbi:MAG: flavoprotein [Zavarzinella sp.]